MAQVPHISQAGDKQPVHVMPLSQAAAGWENSSFLEPGEAGGPGGLLPAVWAALAAAPCDAERSCQLPMDFSRALSSPGTCQRDKCLDHQ